MGIASLVVSIIAIILSIFPAVGLLVAIGSLILAIIAMCRKKNKEVDRGLKIAGLIISIISFLISIFMTVVLTNSILLLKNMGDDLIDNAIEELGSMTEVIQREMIKQYDGKIISGHNVLSLVRQYEESSSVAIIITTLDEVYYVGAGVISLPYGITEEDYKVGGIKKGTFKSGVTNTYLEVYSTISSTTSYKTAVVYDNSNNIIGIAVIEIIDTTEQNDNKEENKNDEIKEPEESNEEDKQLDNFDETMANSNTVKQHGYTIDGLVNLILDEIENYSDSKYLLKDIYGDVTAPKLTLNEAKNNRELYKKTIIKNIDNRYIFTAIYSENNKLVCKCNIEALLNKLELSSHMGAGLKVDRNGIQEFILEK